MFKRFQELPASCIIDSRPCYGGAIKDSNITECSRESSLLGKEINAIDINSANNSPIKRKPTKDDLVNRKRPLLSLKKDLAEETIDIRKDIELPPKKNQVPFHSAIATISRAKVTNTKAIDFSGGITHFLLKAAINPSKVKDGSLNSNLKRASNWELCIESFPVFPEDGCFANQSEYPEKKRASPNQRELSKPSSSLITLNFPIEGCKLDSLSPYILAFDVASEDMDIPCPCVLIGWYSFNGSASTKLHALSYLSLFPNFQDSIASQFVNIDGCNEADTEEFLWKLQSIKSIKLDFVQLEVQDCTGALIDDGPLVFLIHCPLGKADWDLLTWDVSNNESSCSKLNSAQKVLGILSMPDKLFLIYTQSTSSTCTRLIATHITLNLDSNDTFDCGVPSDLVTNLSSAYITDLSFESSTEIFNPHQDCLLKGWLGLTGGQVISLESALSESYNIDNDLSFNQGHYDVQFIQPNPQGKGLLIRLLAKEKIEAPMQWIFMCSGEYKKIHDVAIVSSYGAMLHILLNTEKSLQITEIGSLTEKASSHPALDGALNRLVSHCQTEAARCADSSMLLLQKARLIQDELVLLQSIGFEFSSSLALGPVKQIYPVLAPPPTTCSYFHALESTHTNEVELDPAIGSWLPPSHRVLANCAGFFYNPFVLGQAWMQLHITNIHCNSVYHLDILACLTLPDAQLEVQIYWPSDYSNQLIPSMQSTPTLLLHILKLPNHCTLQSVWKHLWVSVKWQEQASARTYQTHIHTPHFPVLLTRPDFLPISPVVLSLTGSPSLFKLSSLLQLNFGMKFLDTETAFLCQARYIVVKLIQPSPEAMQLNIHGLSPTLLWDFISRLSNLLASLGSAQSDFCLKWQPSTMLIPAHCNTLKLIKDRHTTSDYSALLTYLMGKLHLT